MFKSILKVLFVLFISTSSFATEERKNRIAIFDIGYSTAIGGYLAVGYGREVMGNSLISGYWKSWYLQDEKAYGVNYKYFLDQESTSKTSWFFSGNLQSGGLRRGDFKNMTILSAFGGYQWTTDEVPLGVSLESGANYSDLEGVSLNLIKVNFMYLF